MNFENFELFPKVVTIYKYDQEKHQKIIDITNQIIENIKPGNSEYSKNAVDNSLTHYYNQSTSSLLYECEELEDFRKWCSDCAKHFMTEVLDYTIEENNSILVTDSDGSELKLSRSICGYKFLTS